MANKEPDCERFMILLSRAHSRDPSVQQYEPVIQRLWSGTVMAYGSEEGAVQTAKEFLRLAQLATASQLDKKVFGVLNVVDTVKGRLVMSALVMNVEQQ